MSKEDKIKEARSRFVNLTKPKLPFPERLQKATKIWEAYSEPMRKCVQRMLSEYANAWYSGGEKGGRTSMSINLIDRGVQILAPFLVARNPKVMITPRVGTNNPNIKPFARTLELALHHLFDEIKLAQYTLRPAVINSLFSLGITKTGIWKSHEVEIGGYLHDYGQPYCDVIDFNDYVGDVMARNPQEMKMEGHKYRLPLEFVMDSGLFKHWGNLSPGIPAYGDDLSPDEVSKRGHDKRQERELRPTVELIDLWLPEEGVVVTIPPEGQGTKIMRTVEYDGPETGPFDKLGYRYFPDSCIPIPPVYTWLDINKTVNVIINKMKEQSEREKTIGVYPIDAAEDAEVLRDAKHGDLVGLVNSDAVKEITFGGWNPESFGFLQFLLAQYSRSGPNLEVLGGKDVKAETLGQEQMLQGNAMREVDAMIDQVHDFTTSITRKLAWHLWSDPLIVLPLIKRVAGIDLQVEYSEAAKEGEFFDYTFDIEAFSMARMNPEIRYQRLMQLLSQVVMPLAPIAAQQGSSPNVTELVKEAGRYLNIKNIEDWWIPSFDTATPGPYQPVQGTVGSPGQGDNRFPTGETEASKLSNLSGQQTRSPLESSKKL